MPLHTTIKAINQNDIATLRNNIESGDTDINAVDQAGNSLLMHAVLENNQAAIIYLLENGAHFLTKNVEQETPLSYALMNYQTDIAHLIIDEAIKRVLATDYNTYERARSAATKLRKRNEKRDIQLCFNELKEKHLQCFLTGNYASIDATLGVYHQEFNQMTETMLVEYRSYASRLAVAETGEEEGEQYQQYYDEAMEAYRLLIEEVRVGFELPVPVPDNPDSPSNLFWEQENLWLHVQHVICAIACAKARSLIHYEEQDEQASIEYQATADYFVKRERYKSELHGIIDAACPDPDAMALRDLQASDNSKPFPAQGYPAFQQDSLIILLNAGFPVNLPDYNLFTLLHHAIYLENMPCILELTNEKWRARLDLLNNQRQTATDLALLNQEFYDILKQRRYEYQAFVAIEQNSKELLEEAIENGLNVDVQDVFKNRLVHLAAAQNQLSLVRLLILNRATRMPLNAFNQTPIEFAGNTINPNIVELLDVHEFRDRAFASVTRNNVNELQGYLEAGLPVDTRDDHGRTLLYRAVSLDKEPIAALLIARNASVLIADAQGITVLDIARQKQGQLYHRLEEQTNQERLYSAVRNNRLGIVKSTLAKYPCLLNRPNPNGSSHLYYSVLYHRVDIAEYLLGLGADYLQANLLNETAVNAAYNNDNKPILLIIKERWQNDIKALLLQYQQLIAKKHKRQVNRILGSITKKLQRLFELQRVLNASRGSAHKRIILFAHLDLTSMQLTEQGTRFLFQMLMRTNTITSLDFSFQKIFTDVKRLSELQALIATTNCVVERVNLSHLGLAEKHLDPLVKLLEAGTLVELNLSYNCITQQMGQHFLSILREKKGKLHDLNLNHNLQLTWQFYRELKDILTSKQLGHGQHIEMTVISSSESDSGSEDVDEMITQPRHGDGEFEDVPLDEDKPKDNKPDVIKDEGIDDSHDDDIGPIHLLPRANMWQQLQQLATYSGKQIHSNRDADSDCIRDHLQAYLPDDVIILEPTVFYHATPLQRDQARAKRGAIELAKILMGFEKLNTANPDSSRSQTLGYFNIDVRINKPIVTVLPQQSAIVLADGADIPIEQSGEHWVLLIILPANYQTPNGERLDNENEQLFIINSANLNETMPDILLEVLQQGGAIEYMHEGHTYRETVRAVCPDGEVQVFNPSDVLKVGDAFRQQRLGSRDCGWWVLYNAIMTVLTGSVDYINQLPYDRNGVIAQKMRGLFPLPGEEALHRQAEVISHARLQLVNNDYLVDEKNSDVEPNQVEANDFLSLINHCRQILVEVLNQPAFVEMRIKKHMMRMNAIHFFLSKILKKMSEIESAYLRGRSSLNTLHYDIEHITKLCEYFENLIQKKWLQPFKLYQHAAVSQLYYKIRMTQDALISKYQAQNGVLRETIANDFNPENIFNTFSQCFYNWMRALRVVILNVDSDNTINHVNTNTLKPEDYKNGRISSMFQPSWVRNQAQALMQFTNAHRFNKEECNDILRDTLSPEQLSEVSEQVLPSELSLIFNNMLCNETRLGKLISGLVSAFDERRNNIQLITALLDDLSTLICFYYREQLLLLSSDSLSRFAEHCVYHLADFIALSGSIMTEKSPEFLFAAMNWLFYGKSRKPISLTTRLGERVNSLIFLQSPGLKFTNSDAMFTRINVAFENEIVSSGERWGARVGTLRESEKCKFYVDQNLGERVQRVCFQHEYGEDLMPHAGELQPINFDLTKLQTFKQFPSQWEKSPLNGALYSTEEKRVILDVS